MTQLAEIKPARTERKLVGNFEWFDSKQMHVSALYDRVAVSKGRLVMASLVGTIADIKAMRAAVGSKCESGMTLSGTVPDNIVADKISADGYGYTIAVHRLPYAMCHAVFISRRDGLLLNDSDAALWAELKDTRYSTPLLQAWLPWLRGQLELTERLVDAACVGCNCRILTAETKDMDELVELGLKNGHLTIEEE